LAGAHACRCVGLPREAMMDRLLIWLRSVAVPLSLAVSALAGGSVLVAFLKLGKGLGVGSAAGVTVFVLGSYLLGMVIQASQRAARREQAFLWQGPAADADAFKHFTVRPSREGKPGVDLSPYVERNVTDQLTAGLTEQRLVIVKGQRPSGRSRLIYEVLRRRPDARVLVSTSAPKGVEDPLVELMADHRGLKKSREPMVLLLRDCVSRLISGDLTTEFMWRWLEREPRAAIIITFSPSDLTRIEQSGPEVVRELERLERQARVVTVSQRLMGKELDQAEKEYPHLPTTACEYLPEYLCSAKPLREKFTDSAVGPNARGHAIVCAVVDWCRSGMDCPAPVSFVQAMCANYLPQEAGGDFAAQLQWACEGVDSVTSLITEQDGGYVPDPIVVDILDEEHSRRLPPPVWGRVREEILLEAQPKSADSQTVDRLIALGVAALERDHQSFGTETLDMAELGGDDTQRDRIAQMRTPKPAAGSPYALVMSRRGDTFRQRLVETQRIVDGPGPGQAWTGSAPAKLWGSFVAWVYRRRTARMFARVAALIVIDALSLAVGVAVGLTLRAKLDGHGFSSVISSVLRFLPLWVAVAVLVFARLGLYRQDAPRARLSPILLAGAMLGGIGLIAAWVTAPEVGALPAAVLGSLLAVVCVTGSASGMTI
jgi:hypothetical protein